jgi:hypothetical protein
METCVRAAQADYADSFPHPSGLAAKNTQKSGIWKTFCLCLVAYEIEHTTALDERE